MKPRLELGLRPRFEQEMKVKRGKDALHLNLTGRRGAGKSTSAYHISRMFKTKRIYEYTNRPPRLWEPYGEKIFLTDKKFSRLEERGRMLAWEGAIRETPLPGGGCYRRGTPVREDWPTPSRDTELILSILGPWMSLEIERRLNPSNWVTVFLDGSDEELLSRIIRRYGRDSQLGHMKKNVEYRELRYAKQFQHVVWVDGLTEFEVVEKILGKVNLPNRKILGT